MDSGDSWAARLVAAKHQQHSHHGQCDCIGLDDLEVDDDPRLEFSCPYCFEDFDISTLCLHLEEEHSCESRGVVCPVCGIKVNKDMVAHITIQHTHLLNIHRRRRVRRNGMPLSTMLSFLGRELREAHLQALLGGGGRGSGGSSGVTDSLLSALAQSLHLLEAEDSSKHIPPAHDQPANPPRIKQSRRIGHVAGLDFESPEVRLSAEEYKKKIQQDTLRANYVQQLVLSTLLEDG